MARNLTFPAGSGDGAVQCLSISITADGDVLEGEEAFDVTLTTPDMLVLGNFKTIIIIAGSECSGRFLKWL